MAQILPIAALRGKERVTEALKGDVYTRSWQTTKGKGKKKKVVEHELHINPVTAVVAVAGGTLAAGLVAWMGMRTLKQTGYQLTTGPKTMVRVLRVYDMTYQTVVDTPEEVVPGYWTWEKYTRVWVEGHTNPAMTHQEPIGQRAIVFTKKGIPIREWKGDSIALEWPQSLSKRQLSEGWTWADTMGETSGTDRFGDYRQMSYVLVNPKLKGAQLTPYTPAEKTSLINIDLL